MKTFPLISIVVINWNGARYLKRTIPALLKLTYPNLEIIVVDNSSTDKSTQYLKKIKAITVINNPLERSKNRGANLGISNASGQYILLLDNDALIENKDILNDLLDMYQKQERIGVIGLSFADEGKVVSKSYGNPLGYYYIEESKELPLESIRQMSGKYIAFPEGKGFFIKKSIWLDAGGYDDLIPFGGDDSDLGIRLWIFGYKNILYSKSIQLHIGEAERKNNKKYALKLQDMISGHLFSIIKNYSFLNMTIALFGFSAFAFLKSIKQAWARKYPQVVASFFFAHAILFKNLREILRKRSQVQSKRIIKDDIFLAIK